MNANTRVAAGSTTDKLVLNTDLASTCAELAGTTFADDGRSLLPLFRGESSPWRTSILLEGYEGDELPASYQALVTESHKYVEYDNGEKELYDLVDDPYEMESLHESADPAFLDDLKARLEALRDCSGDGCGEAEDAP